MKNLIYVSLAFALVISQAIHPFSQQTDQQAKKTSIDPSRNGIERIDHRDEISDERVISWRKKYRNAQLSAISSIEFQLQYKQNNSVGGVLYINSKDKRLRGYREGRYNTLHSYGCPFKFKLSNGKTFKGQLFEDAPLRMNELRDGVENRMAGYLFYDRLDEVNDNFYKLASELGKNDKLLIRLSGSNGVPSLDLSKEQIGDLVYMIQQSRAWLETNDPNFVANAYTIESHLARLGEAVASANRYYEQSRRTFDRLKQTEATARSSMNNFRNLRTSGRSLPRRDLGYDSEYDSNTTSPPQNQDSLWSNFSTGRYESVALRNARERMEQAKTDYEKAQLEFEKWKSNAKK